MEEDKHFVSVNEKPCELTFKEYELLKLLLTNAGIVVGRDTILEKVEALEAALADLKGMEDIKKTSEAVRDDVLPKMDDLRSYVDEAEMLTSEECWPFPSYGKLLFSVY